MIGKAIADGHDRDLYHPYKSYQTVEARKLAKKLNISEDTQIDLEHIKQVEILLDKLNHFDYVGSVEKIKKIFIYNHDNHYWAIRSLAALFGKKFWCFSCMHGYDKYHYH